MVHRAEHRDDGRHDAGRRFRSSGTACRQASGLARAGESRSAASACSIGCAAIPSSRARRSASSAAGSTRRWASSSSATSSIPSPSTSARRTRATSRAPTRATRRSRSSTRRRQPMVYVGANDGMLHAFDDATGNETMAYVPSQLYRGDATGLGALTYQDGALPRVHAPLPRRFDAEGLGRRLRRTGLAHGARRRPRQGRRGVLRARHHRPGQHHERDEGRRQRAVGVHGRQPRLHLRPGDDREDARHLRRIHLRPVGRDRARRATTMWTASAGYSSSTSRPARS